MPFALILVRWLHLSASMLLAGLFLFETVIVVPAARKPSADIEHLLSRIHRLTGRVAFWTLLVALFSWFAWSWLVASTMTGDNLIECLQTGDWLTVLTGTQFGHLWLFRMMVNLVFGINLWLASRPEKRSAPMFNSCLAFGHRARLPGVGWSRRCGFRPVRGSPTFR